MLIRNYASITPRSEQSQGLIHAPMVGHGHHICRGLSLRVHKTIRVFDSEAPYSICPAHHNTGLLDLLIPAHAHDGLVGFFCSSNHHRARVARSEVEGAVILTSGAFGASVFAVRRADKDASIIFRYMHHVERHTFTAEGAYLVSESTDSSKESL